MTPGILRIGDRVCVTSDSPFKGLKGVIREVDLIDHTEDNHFLFYQVSLECASLRDPSWFQGEEIDALLYFNARI